MQNQNRLTNLNQNDFENQLMGSRRSNNELNQGVPPIFVSEGATAHSQTDALSQTLNLEKMNLKAKGNCNEREKELEREEQEMKKVSDVCNNLRSSWDEFWFFANNYGSDLDNLLAYRLNSSLQGHQVDHSELMSNLNEFKKRNENMKRVLKRMSEACDSKF